MFSHAVHPYLTLTKGAASDNLVWPKMFHVFFAYCSAQLMIILHAQAALDNVRAVAASSLKQSSARSVFARADVVLAWYTSGADTHLVPLINEVSLLNSASKLISFWQPPREASHWPQEVRQEWATRKEQLPPEQQVRGGWGYTLAKAVAEAVARRFTELHCASCAGEVDIRAV